MSKNSTIDEDLFIPSVHSIRLPVDKMLVTVLALLKPRGSIFQNGFLTPDYHIKNAWKKFFSMILRGWGCNQDWGCNRANMVEQRVTTITNKTKNDICIQILLWLRDNVIWRSSHEVLQISFDFLFNLPRFQQL